MKKINKVHYHFKNSVYDCLQCNSHIFPTKKNSTRDKSKVTCWNCLKRLHLASKVYNTRKHQWEWKRKE